MLLFRLGFRELVLGSLILFKSGARGLVQTKRELCFLTDSTLFFIATASNLLQAVCVLIGRFDSKPRDFVGTLSLFTGTLAAYLKNLELENAEMKCCGGRAQ